jgi:hypothetical protein
MEHTVILLMTMRRRITTKWGKTCPNKLPENDDLRRAQLYYTDYFSNNTSLSDKPSNDANMGYTKQYGNTSAVKPDITSS